MVSVVEAWGNLLGVSLQTVLAHAQAACYYDAGHRFYAQDTGRTSQSILVRVMN
jgi:hypothetical protein